MSVTDEKYLSVLYEAYFESSKQFDKQILFISTGALAVSFSFIRDIVDLDESGCNLILLLSWILFTIVILLSLISHYFSKQALNNKIEEIDSNKTQSSVSLNKTVKCINILMIIKLFLGLILLITFIGINI